MRAAHPHAIVGLINLGCQAAFNNFGNHQRVRLVADLEHILLADNAEAAVGGLPCTSEPEQGEAARMRGTYHTGCAADYAIQLTCEAKSQRSICCSTRAASSARVVLDHGFGLQHLQIVERLPHVTISCEDDCFQTAFHSRHLRHAV